MTIRSVSILEREIEELEKQAGLKPQEDPEPEDGAEDEPAPITETTVEEVKPEAKPDEEKGWAKRYADLRTLQQKTAAQLKEALAQKSQPAAVTEEQVKEWVKTNPKAAEIIRAIAVQSAPVEDLTEIKQELAQAKAKQTIVRSHPDFDEIIETDAFHEWADKQPPRVQELIFSEKPEDVIWALDFYKEHNAPKVDAKKDAAKLVKTKAGAEAPSDKSTPVYSESVVQKMSLQEYEKHEEAILKAQKTGNFIYDLSGAAR